MLLYPLGLSGPLFLLLLALALDAVLGDGRTGWARLAWRFVPHPVEIVGNAVGWLDLRLNREGRSEHARFVRGLVIVAGFVVAAAVFGLALGEMLRIVRFGWAVEIVIVAALLAQRRVFDAVARAALALQRNGLFAGRDAVRDIARRDPESLDEYGVARAAIEALAENFGTGVVAPAFWYALFGLPGLFVYKTADILDSRLGHRSPRHLVFGWAAARLDGLLQMFPARLSGLLLGLAALAMPQASFPAALRAMRRDARKHRSPNRGWPEAAAAGALGLALSGPRRTGGALVKDAWLGGGRARAVPADIALALRLYLFGCGAQAALVAAVLVVLEAAVR